MGIRCPARNKPKKAPDSKTSYATAFFDSIDPNPTSVSQTKFGAASTNETHGFAARTLEGTVDPKLLDILVCRISEDALEFGWTQQELISRAAKLAYPIHDW